MKDIVFITFDISRSEYPTMTYSIASMFASVECNGFKASHFPIDIKQILQDKKEETSYKDNKILSYEEIVETQELSNDLTHIVKKRLAHNLNFFKQFRFIAISVSRWSVEHCHALLDLLTDYNGKIILGGYEITAISDDLLIKEFPKANHFIKGFAERALVKLLRNEIEPERKIIIEKISSKDLYSPYLTGILGLFTRKVYWETKRGCRFSCGFCEWGALKDKVLVDIDLKRLTDEIDLIGKSNVEELNILDGTFNFGKYYIEILEYILKTTELKVTFQARFEMLIGNNADEFLKLCSQYKDRIHMEFGLQTIHEDEMRIIGRNNKMDKIQSGLEKLNKYNIDYETSIIYAIPGQTVEKMIDTIEFLLTNDCRKICAYPLQIAKNSYLEQNKQKLLITEEIDLLKVSSVESSYSFSRENRRDMDLLAERLQTNDLNGTKTIQPDLLLEQVTNYQYELLSTNELEKKDYLVYLIDRYFEEPTTSDFYNFDYSQSMGHLARNLGKAIPTRTEYINNLNKGLMFYEIKKSEPIDFEFNGHKMKFRNSDKNIKFFCKIRLGKSGNYYVFREIIYGN